MCSKNQDRKRKNRKEHFFRLRNIHRAAHEFRGRRCYLLYVITVYRISSIFR